MRFKKPIIEEKARRMQRHLENRVDVLRKEARLLGNRFHGRKDESLERVRAGGLKKERAREGATIFSDALIADLNVYSKGPKSVVHSVTDDFLKKEKEKGNIFDDFYAGHHERHVLVNIPREEIKTFVKNVRGGIIKYDPLLMEIEKKMNEGGKTMRQHMKDAPFALQHEINYYSTLLADDAYEKHKDQIRKEVEEQLKETGRVAYKDMKNTMTRLRILPELRDAVVGGVFLDMKLKKSGKGFVK
jgi:hypothetical protein